MRLYTFETHAARSACVYLLLLVFLGRVDADRTTTTTITSTSFLTLTSTITPSGSSIPVVTTQTETLVGGTMVSSSFATAIQSTAGAVATGAMSYTGDALQVAVMNSTNYYRAQHQASALSWNDTLAKYAQDYASKCVWKHSGGPYGENLAEGYDSPVPAVDAWAGEESKYNYAKPKFHESTGHYTQLVWQNTTSVGCGAVQCNSDSSGGVKGWMMVCEYFPPGNVGGEYRQQVLKPGENAKDQLGFGAAPKIGVGRQLIGALVVSYLLVALVL